MSLRERMIDASATFLRKDTLHGKSPAGGGSGYVRKESFTKKEKLGAPKNSRS